MTLYEQLTKELEDLDIQAVADVAEKAAYEEMKAEEKQHEEDAKAADMEITDNGAIVANDKLTKELTKSETEPVKSEDLKKMHLEESLFEAYEGEELNESIEEETKNC